MRKPGSSIEFCEGMNWWYYRIHLLKSIECQYLVMDHFQQMINDSSITSKLFASFNMLLATVRIWSLSSNVPSGLLGYLKIQWCKPSCPLVQLQRFLMPNMKFSQNMFSILSSSPRSIKISRTGILLALRASLYSENPGAGTKAPVYPGKRQYQHIIARLHHYQL